MKARRTKKRSTPRASAAALQKRLRQAERRLREVEERYEIAMGAINEGVYDWDIVKDKIFYSESVQRALGLPPEVLRTRKDWWNRIHPDDLPRYRGAFVAHFKGETERFECDYRYRALDGSWRWARQHAVALRDKHGRAVRMVGANGDITELKQVEDSLRKSEERYALATSAAVEGIYEWDLVTGMLYLTERAKSFFSFPAEQLTPAAWNRRVHGDDFAAYRAAIIDHFKGRTPHMEHEYRVADAHGGYKWVLERGIGVRNAQGRVVKVVGALSDVTQRKLAEIELRRARDEAEEALEQQTATAEILRVTSSSPTEVEPVFRSILSNASRLCQASVGAVFLFDGEVLTNVAHENASPEFAEFLKHSRPRPSRETTTRRCALERRTVHTADLLNDPEYTPLDFQRRENVRTVLSVPMIRDDVLVGVITLWRREVRPFADKQIALVQTFADQAVIAIENVRLFNETQEALEQQTAISEILHVISGSPGDVARMLEAVALRAVKLCESGEAGIFLLEGERLRFAAGCQSGETFKPGETMPLSRGSVLGRAVVDRETVHVVDLATAAAEEFPLGLEYQKRFGHRSLVAVPLMQKDRAIGVIGLWRFEVRAFSDRHIALVRTFADQAAIAIENVRLFNEIRESLEQQKASAEVLGVISSSIADTAPVFDKILESCERLFAGRIVGLNLVREDGMLHIGAYHGAHREEFERIFPLPLTPESGSGLSIVERRVVHYPDTERGEDVPAKTRQGCKAIGIKSAIFAPMLWEGRGMGAIFVGRDHVSSFSEKEIALLKTFADQAAIAIENVRLFNEIQEKGRQLEIANKHKSEFLANMSHELRTPLNAIIGFTRIVMRRSQEQLEPKQYENLEKILTSGQNLLALINAILDLSKVEAGRVELHPAETPLAPVLEQCLRTVEPLIEAGAVTLVKEFDGALPQMYVDEEKLRQIVINLLSNAAKFTAGGCIRLQAHAANGAVAIAVADTGIGIAPDKLDLIFEEFEQADASSTRVYGGTGLGLAIARRLARLMGGEITAESALGSGSKFTLRLPLRYRSPEG